MDIRTNHLVPHRYGVCLRLPCPLAWLWPFFHLFFPSIPFFFLLFLAYLILHSLLLASSLLTISITRLARTQLLPSKQISRIHHEIHSFTFFRLDRFQRFSSGKTCKNMLKKKFFLNWHFLRLDGRMIVNVLDSHWFTCLNMRANTERNHKGKVQITEKWKAAQSPRGTETLLTRHHVTSFTAQLCYSTRSIWIQI